MKRKIIIDNQSSLSDCDALYYVINVIKRGLISGCGDKKQYCYNVRFLNKFNVSCFLRKKSYKFVIYDERDE